MENIESHFRELLDTSPDATVALDDSGTILFANAQASTLFGYTHEELMGAPVEMLLPERLKESHGHKAYYTRKPQVRPMGSGLELYSVRKDGTEFPIEISLSPLKTTDGRLVSMSVRDITDRRMAQAALSNAKEDAERANTAKTRFLAAASHDLRQPLQSMSIYLDVLSKLIRANPDKADEVVQKMGKSVRVMGELLDTLLDVSKLESGVIEPDIQSFPLQSVFDSLLVDNEPVASAQGLTLTILPTDATVESDQALLLRVLENFVANAIRYTDKGSVTVSAQTVEEGIRVDVKDTGIGIPDAALGKIFDEYTQLDNPVRDRKKGLGLGLNLVKRLSSLLECPLSVQSVLGKGSTFSIVVPIPTDLREVSDPDPAVQQPRAAGTRVLYVEDDADVLEATQMLLELSNLEVSSTSNGERAVELLRSGYLPDILVSDYQLPGASGYEIGVVVRQLGHEIPIIIVTGDTTGQKDKLLQLGNITILKKPVEPADLLDKISKLVEVI